MEIGLRTPSLLSIGASLALAILALVDYLVGGAAAIAIASFAYVVGAFGSIVKT